MLADYTATVPHNSNGGAQKQNTNLNSLHTLTSDYRNTFPTAKEPGVDLCGEADVRGSWGPVK